MGESMQHPDLLRVPAIDADARAQFIVSAYNHLFGAILLFTFIEWALFASGAAETVARGLLSVNWLFVLGGFVLVSWMASRAAYAAQSTGVQYLALAGFVAAEAVIFVPLLFMANYYAPGAITSAATVTLIGFAGLTAIVFWTRKDFSFLRAALRWGGLVALLLIVAGAMFGFVAGTWFSVAMVALAGASVLYDTSNILHRFPTDRPVAAALQLFASIALMFWYVLRLFMSRR